MFAIINVDGAPTFVEGPAPAPAHVEVPDNLLEILATQPQRIVWDGNELRDAAEITTWYVGPDGTRLPYKPMSGWKKFDGLAWDATVPRQWSKAELVAYAATVRWKAEQAGAVWNGWPIHTDDRSQGKYLSELQAITLGVRVDGDPWKFADGIFRPVTNQIFPQLAIAAREHVRSVYGLEGAVLAAIEAGAITSAAQIDAAGWSANG